MRKEVMLTALQPLALPLAEKIPELRSSDPGHGSASLFSNGNQPSSPSTECFLPTCLLHHTLSASVPVCITITVRATPPQQLPLLNYPAVLQGMQDIPRSFETTLKPVSLSRVSSCTPIMPQIHKHASSLLFCLVFACGRLPVHASPLQSLVIAFLFFYLRKSERESKSMHMREKGTGRESENLTQAPCPTQSPMWGFIP